MPTRKPRRAVVYARVSSAQGGRDKAVSIGEQIADCKRLIAENGDRLVATYIDDAAYRSEAGRIVQPSAKRHDRPEWVKLLAGAGQSYDVLYAWRTDRICRGNETAGMFERVLDDTRIDVVLVTQIFDRDTFGLLAGGVSGYELRNIRVRMMMGREGRIKQGHHQGGLPLGYVQVRDDTGRTINYRMLPEWRSHFDTLAALFLERVPLAEIGRRLAPATGRAYSHATIRYWLKTPFYRGQLEYGRATRPPESRIYNAAAVHPPAWDAATIAAIDAEWERRDHLGKRGPRRRKHVYLFSGVLRCGYCGRPLARGGESRGGELIGRRYQCNQPREVRTGLHAGPAHPTLNVSEAKVDEWLQAELGTLTVAGIDAWLEGVYGQPTAAPAAQYAAQADADQLEAKVLELRAALERVADIPPAAAAMAQTLHEAERSLAEAQTRVGLATVRAHAIERAVLKAKMLELLALRDKLAALTYAEKAELYPRLLPPLHVKPTGFVPKSDAS